MRQPIGQAALRQMLRLEVPEPAVQSFLAPGTRRTEVHGDRVLELYPRVHAVDDSAVSHLKFALRYEAFDLGLIVEALKRIPGGELEAWIQAEPTGTFSRRAWFFYETFTGGTLAVPAVSTGNYVDALDPELFFVSSRRNSPRHRVVDNLLGGPGFCPTVRWTKALEAHVATDLHAMVRRLTEAVDPAVLKRAVTYLYTKETRSSFEIEGEVVSLSRSERFVAALKDAGGFRPTKPGLIDLQNQIVDPRYAATDWRAVQNYVGESLVGYRQKIHYVCPRPGDVPALMASWEAMTDRLAADENVHPVIAAALAAFGFVFIHPFEDGNGRIHRFLVHSLLSRKGLSPEGIIFPISASILRDTARYDAALEAFSEPIKPFIDYAVDSDGEMEVRNETLRLYSTFDATVLVEYLFERVIDTVQTDLRDELEFIRTYDRAMKAVVEQIDMPSQKASLFVRLCLQNNGRLSNNKRAKFPELSDADVARLEHAIHQGTAEADRRSPGEG